MPAAVSEETAEMLQERLISAEHKIWKLNSPFLYDFVLTLPLGWPSLTCQWLPGQTALSSEAVQHELLLGTHTTAGEPNYLMVATCTVPTENAQIDMREYDDETREVGGFGFVNDSVGTIEIKRKIRHEGEVNRARYMPQNSSVIATRGPTAELFVWDLTRHPAFPSNDKNASPFAPQGICKGHTKEGYAMDWSSRQEGMLLSGADDATVRLWDVRAAYSNGSQSGTEILATKTFRAHTDTVEDVAWHNRDPNLIGSVGDDQRLCLWDVRDDSKTAQTVEKAHESDINCLAFNPIQEFILATGSADATIGIWDMRNMTKPMNRLLGHTDQVFQLEWNPSNESILGSCSADRRVALWDLARIGEEQSPDEAEDGPPELLFLHGGHTSKVSDFSWNPNVEYGWTVASVSDDSILQIWSPAEDIYADGKNSNEDGARGKDKMDI